MSAVLYGLGMMPTYATLRLHNRSGGNDRLQPIDWLLVLLWPLTSVFLILAGISYRVR